MYFSYRPSGGRGEYELAGAHGDWAAHDLLGWTFRLDAGPFGIKTTELLVTEQGGKLRLRVALAGVPHIQRQIAGLLMLPESTRDQTRVSGGLPVVIEKRYLMERMNLASVEFDEGNETATVRLGAISLRSGVDHVESVSFARRLARVHEIHRRVDDLPEGVASALDQHSSAVHRAGAVGADAPAAVKRIAASLTNPAVAVLYAPKTDPLPVLEDLVGIAPIAGVPPTEVASDESEIKRRETSIMRLQRSRGASGARFRRAVHEAYEYRCIFCGLRLPKGDVCSVPGVDAAHILPYADYDLDVPANGLCLCKLHHWAFDQQLLVLHHSAGTYHVELSRRATLAFASDPETIDELRAVEGAIPEARLPTLMKHRPRAEFLDRLYSDVPPDA